MKGIVFQALEEFIEEHFSLGLWDAMIAASKPPSGGIYVSAGSYSDSELMRYIALLTKHTGKSADEIMQIFGVYLFEKLVAVYPYPLESMSLKEFLLTIDKVVHVEVKKLYPHAHVPKFICEEIEENVIILHYQSEKKLFALAHGLILGASKYFKTPVVVKSFVKEDGAQCTFAIKFVSE